MGHSKHSRKRKRRETSSSSSEDEEDTSSEEETSSSAQQTFQWLQEQMISFQQRLNELQRNVSAPKRKSQTCQQIQQEIYLLEERKSIIQQEMDTYQQNEGQQTEDLDPPDQPSVSPQHTPPQSPKYSPPPLEPRVLRPRTTKPTPGTSSRGRGRPRRSSRAVKLPDIQLDLPDCQPNRQTRSTWALPGRPRQWSSEDIPLQPLEQSAGYAVAGPSGIRRPSRKPRDHQSSDDDSSSGDTPKQPPDYAVAGPSGVLGPSRKRGRYREPNDRQSSDNDSSSNNIPLQTTDHAVAGPSRAPATSRKGGPYKNTRSKSGGLGKGSRAMEQQKPLVRVQGTPGNAGQMHHTAAAADGPARHLRSANAKRIQPRAPATVDDPTTERVPFASAVQEERQPLLRALLSAKPASDSTIQSPVATSNVRPHCKGYRKLKTEWMLRAPLVTDYPSTEQQTVSDMLPELQRSERRRSSPTSETLESPTTQQQTSRFVNEGVTSSLDTLAATACAVKMQQSVSKRSEIQATDLAPPTFDSLMTQQQTSTFVNKPEPMSGYSLETLAAAASLLELHRGETQRTAATTEFPKPPPRKSTPQTQKVSSFRRYLEPLTTAGNSLLPQPQLCTASATPTHSQLPSDNSSVQLVEADSGAEEKQAFVRAWEDPHSTAARAASSVRGQFDNRAWYQPISGRPQSPLLTEVVSTTDPPRATRTEICDPRDDAPQVSWPWTTTQESAAQMVPSEAIFSGESASQKKSDSLPPHYSLSSRPLPYLEDRAGTHDTWQASFSVVPEMPKTVPPSVSRNGHQITSTDVMNPFIPLASRQTVLKAMHNHTCISKPSLNQMIAPDIDHMPNLMPPPNSTYVPKSLANKIPFWHESDVADVMPQLVSTCVPKRGRQKIRNLTSETEPSLQGTSAGTPSERRPRRPRGRPCRRGSARYPAQYSVVSTAQCSPQPTAQCCAQPAPTTPAQSAEQVTRLSSIRHAAQRPKTPLEKNREQFPQQAPPQPKMQQQRRRMGKNLGRGRGQRSAKYVAGTTVQPLEKLPVAVKPVPAEHRVKMLAPLLFNPPAIHFVVQKLHWTYLPRIATVYGDPRRAPQAIETLVDGPQEVPMPRPAHLLQLTHLFMKYSAPQCPPAPYAIPLRPPLDRGGHQRKTSDVIQMADRATADLAVSVAISLSVREDPMSDGRVQHHRSQARNGSEQAAYELPLNLSWRRHEFHQQPGRSSQPAPHVIAATAGSSHLMMGISQSPQTTYAQASVLPQQIERSWSINDEPQLSSQHAKGALWPSDSAPPAVSKPADVVTWPVAGPSHAAQQWPSDSAPPIFPSHEEVTWPTAGPSHAAQKFTAPQSTVIKSQMPSQHAGEIPWSILGNSHIPTQHVGVSWPITNTSQVSSQHMNEGSWPIIGRSQSRTETVPPPSELRQHEYGQVEQTNNEWPTDTGFPSPKLSESSDDSSNSSETANSHRRKQKKTKIIRQINSY